jgi:hypothetical protein
MISHWLIDECTFFTTTRNEYGDIVYGSPVVRKCRVREINDITRAEYREQLDADLMIWFAGTENVKINDVFIYQGDYYRIDEINKARKGFQTNIEFLRCLVSKQRQVS